MTTEPERRNARARLRAAPLARPFHVVLVEPEIPPNTGNIARLCAATGCPLHLVGKLGFRIDEHAVRRAGLDYWHLVDVRTHADLDAALDDVARDAGASPRAASGPGCSAPRPSRATSTPGFELGDALVFGKESVGLAGRAARQRSPERVVGIPTLGAVRSLNLANAVSIALYEALRQNHALGRCTARVMLSLIPRRCGLALLKSASTTVASIPGLSSTCPVSFSPSV